MRVEKTKQPKRVELFHLKSSKFKKPKYFNIFWENLERAPNKGTNYILHFSQYGFYLYANFSK